MMGLQVEEWQQALMAYTVVQSNLTDANEASRINAQQGAVARQLQIVDAKVDTMLTAFGFDCEGQLLDDRMAQEAGLAPRQTASPAQGACLTLSRDSSVGALLVPAGSVYVSAAGNAYVQIGDVTFLDGSLTFPTLGQSPGYLVCTRPGSIGNLDAGALTRVVTAPDSVIGCNNSVALANGLDRETDAQCQRRSLDYVAGGRTQLSEYGLRAFALAYQSSDGTRARNCAVSISPTRPYAEIVVTDGQGFRGLTAPGPATGGTIPQNGQLDAWCVGPVSSAGVTLKVNGVAVPDTKYTLIHERGRLYVNPGEVIWAPGDVWSITDYDRYIGFVAEAQAVIEAKLAYRGQLFGYRAVPTRVRMVVPTSEEVRYVVWVTVAQGFDPNTVYARVREAIVQFHLALGIGAPVQVAELDYATKHLEGVFDISYRNPVDTSIALANIYPSGPTNELVTSGGLVDVNGG